MPVEWVLDASFCRHGIELMLIKPDSSGPSCCQHPDIFQSVTGDSAAEQASSL